MPEDSFWHWKGITEFVAPERSRKTDELGQMMLKQRALKSTFNFWDTQLRKQLEPPCDSVSAEIDDTGKCHFCFEILAGTISKHNFAHRLPL